MYRSFALAALLSIPFTAAAHHGQSLFDRQAPTTLEGIVTQYDWANPHVYIYVEVETDAGDPVVWEVEGQPPAILKRQGWSPDTLAVGERIVITAFPPRDPTRRIALGTAMQKLDGTRLALGFSPPVLSQDVVSPNNASGLAGTWSTILEQSVAMPFLVGPVSRPDLAAGAQRLAPFDWPLTEKGSQAAASFRQETMLPGIECIPYTAPFLMVLPDVKVIEIDDDVVRIRAEFEDVERLVHMNVSSHADATPSLQGHSIGRWEDDALVVDTTHFTDHGVGNAMGLPSGPSKHLVERFELNPDRESLTYSFELEDPEYLAAAVIGDIQWAYQPNSTYAPVECDLDNARRFIGD